MAELIDQTQSINLVGFDPSIQSKLKALEDKKVPILLRNVDVKVNKYTKKLEVVVQRYSEVTTSSKQFHITDIDTIGAKPILLKELPTLKEFDKVNVKVKVLDTKNPQAVGKQLKKQEITIAESSGNCVPAIWQEAIGSLEIGESYYITKLTVRVFRGEYSVSMPANGSSVTKIDDVENVDECLTESNEDSLMGATIIAVKKFEQFNACTYCNGEVKADTAECTKCGTWLILSRCPFNQMAKLDLEGPNTTFLTVVVYNNLIKAIVKKDQQITVTSLLKAKPFDFTYNQYHVATSISRSYGPSTCCCCHKNLSNNKKTYSIPISY